MAERATAAQVTQLGIQPAAVAVAANKKLSSIGFSIAPQLETRTIKPAGAKYPTLAILGKDYSALSVAGDATYDDLAFIAQSALCVPTKVGTGPWDFTYKPSIAGPDTVKVFTLEKGEASPGRTERVPSVQMNELSLAFSRDAIEVGGAAIGGKVEFAANQTASPTALALAPMLPANVCVFLDGTFANLGTTKLLRCLNASWSIGGRYNPLFVLDCAQASYVALVEAEPEISVTLTLEADAQGTALVDTYGRTGARCYNRITCDPSPSTTNSLSIDTCLVVTGVGELSDQDGVYAYELSLTGVSDSAWLSGTITQWAIGCATDVSV